MASPVWLTRTADLEMVRRQGKRLRTSTLEVRTLASLLRHSRVGLIVPRHHHTAVDRNRLKRRLRELVRHNWRTLLETPPMRDVVVRAAPAAYDANFATLGEELARLDAKLRRV